MAVQLKDAKITVEIDMKKSEQVVDSLEERTKEQRKEAEEERKKAKKDTRDSKGRKSSRGILRGTVGIGLFNTVLNIVRSIPFVELFAAGAGLAELNQRLGPYFEGAISKVFADKYGIDVRVMTEGAKEWALFKARFTAFGTALEAAKSGGVADILTGGTFTAEEFSDIFNVEMQYARMMSSINSAKTIREQRLIGGSVAESAVDELRKLFEGAPSWH